LPQDARLHNSTDFRVVYDKGRRFDSRFMSVFVLFSDLARHRLGITASRKMARRAVDRNRAKRLLREAFRQSSDELGALKNRYDWVINARRLMIEVKSDAVAADLKLVIARVRQAEHESFIGTDT